MNKLPHHTALKEWSTVIDALGRGEQVILIRKGGIADPKFGVDADRFYLYPTYYHQPDQGEPERVVITHWCEVAQTWLIRDLDLLYKLEPLVAISNHDLETRYRFRPDQALHVIAVRTFALDRPVDIDVKPEYGGCRSWISVDEEIDIDGSRAVLTAEELTARIEVIDGLLNSSVVI